MLDLDPLLTRVLEQLARLIAYDAAFVATLEAETLTIRAFRSQVPRRDLRGTQLDVTRVPPLHALISTRRPFVLADMQQDTRLMAYLETISQDPVSNHACMSVPLVVQDRVIGVLSLLHQQPAFYTASDLQRVQAFANQVALALENARLYERAREAATLEERHRLARELHDAVTQTLFSASLVADALPDAWHDAPPLAVRGVEHVRVLTHGALAEMRTLLMELRPSALTEKPLGELAAGAVHGDGEPLAGAGGVRGAGRVRADAGGADRAVPHRAGSVEQRGQARGRERGAGNAGVRRGGGGNGGGGRRARVRGGDGGAGQFRASDHGRAGDRDRGGAAGAQPGGHGHDGGGSVARSARWAAA